MKENRIPNRFWLFCVLILIGLLAINRYFLEKRKQVAYPSWEYFYSALYQKPEAAKDVIFLGNSHASSTFNPAIIDDLLGIDSVVLATTAESIMHLKFEYFEVVEHQDTPIIVLEPYVVFAGEDNQEDYFLTYTFFDSIPNRLDRFFYRIAFFQNNNLLKALLPAHYYHWNLFDEDITDVFEFGKQHLKTIINGKTESILPLDGYIEKKLIPSPVLFQDWIENHPKKELNDSQIENRMNHLQDVYEKSNQVSEELIIIDSPQYFVEDENYKNLYRNQFSEWDVPYYQLLDDEELSLIWFHDGGHVSTMGALLTSIETAKILSKELNQPINQNRLAYYQSYLLADYQIVEQAGQVTISLFPQNTEASSDLEYQWEVSIDGEVISSQESSNQPSYTFEASQVGDYYIDVRLWNPSGEYSLPIYFLYTYED